MNENKYYKTSFENKTKDTNNNYIFILILCAWISGVIIGNHLKTINIFLMKKENNYNIVVNGKVRDIRTSPHYDLIKYAWENDENQLLLKPKGDTPALDRKQYYNWLQDKWVDK